MPRIIVQAESSEQRPPATVHEEQVVPADLASEHSSAPLIERIGWAILDAQAIERSDQQATPGQARGG